MILAIVIAFVVLAVLTVLGDGARAELRRRRLEADQPDGASELLRRPLRSRYPL